MLQAGRNSCDRSLCKCSLGYDFSLDKGHKPCSQFMRLSPCPFLPPLLHQDASFCNGDLCDGLSSITLPASGSFPSNQGQGHCNKQLSRMINFVPLSVLLTSEDGDFISVRIQWEKQNSTSYFSRVSLIYELDQTDAGRWKRRKGTLT